jgi:hypothetical protein
MYYQGDGIMHKFKFTVIHQFTGKQIDSYGKSHNHLDLIFDVDKSLKIGLWNIHKEYVITNVLVLFHNYFVTKQNDKKIICARVYFVSEEDRSYNQIIIALPHDKEYYYKICFIFFKDQKDCKYDEINIFKLNYCGDQMLVYNSNPTLEIPKLKVHLDDQLLGMYKPVRTKIRKTLCVSCEYYSNNSALSCAIHPLTNTDRCFDCKDYQLDSIISTVMYEKHYKFYE